jgi:hypothetical protein
MRIRSTKPEFWRSKTIAQFDWETRLVLKALESYVDDNGVGKDSVVIFCADAFPHDLAKSPEICAKVARSLDQLSEAGLIVRYSVADEDLLYIRRWKQWQYIDKPKAGRFPRPDGSMNYRDSVDEAIGPGQGVCNAVWVDSVREGAPELPENFANISSGYPQIQSGEQGNRGSEEQLKKGGSATEVCHQSADQVAPPEKCPLHINTPIPPSCGGCADAGRNYRKWENDRALDKRREAERVARALQEINDAIDSCGDCDDYGRLDDLTWCPNHARRKDVA